MYFLAAFCWRTKPRSTNENNENGKSDGGVWGGIFARGDLKWRLKIKEFISNLVIQWSWVILVVKCWSSLQPCLRTQVWRLNLFQLQTSEVFFFSKALSFKPIWSNPLRQTQGQLCVGGHSPSRLCQAMEAKSHLQSGRRLGVLWSLGIKTKRLRNHIPTYPNKDWKRRS